MATLLQLKAEIEELRGVRMNMVFSGATEAHLLADEIGKHIPTILHAFGYDRDGSDTSVVLQLKREWESSSAPSVHTHPTGITVACTSSLYRITF